MLRIFLSVFVIVQSPVVSATVYTPKYQRRAMEKAISRFTTSLSEEERRNLFETHLASGRAEDRRKKHQALDGLAVDLVDATSNFVRSAREDRLEDTRENLRTVIVHLVRAVGVSTVFSDEESSGHGLGFYTALGGSSFAAWGFTSLASLKFDIGTVANSVGSYGGWTTLGTVAALFLMAPTGWKIPGTTRLAHVLGGSDGLDVFWRKVGRWMKADPLLADVKIKGIEDFRELIARELRGVSLDQACRSALLARPFKPISTSEEDHDS